jgi:cell division protein FtsB
MELTIRCLALLGVAAVCNELMSIYFDLRYVLLGWAVLCLWILFDGSLLAADLTQAERLLAEQTKRNGVLETENMLLITQLAHMRDNHVLLCEIRSRLIHHRHRGHFNDSSDILRAASSPVTLVSRLASVP